MAWHQAEPHPAAIAGERQQHQQQQQQQQLTLKEEAIWCFLEL
jgi:hypothetical protein